MEGTKEYTFTRNADGAILIDKGWPQVDMESATSFRRAILFALNWAEGGYAGQLDAADIHSYLDTLFRNSYHNTPEGFVNSPHYNTALVLYKTPLTDGELMNKAKQIFAFIDTYKNAISRNDTILEGITMLSEVMA